MATVTCKLPPRLDAELSAAAAEEGVSKSVILRKALEKQIGRRRGKKSRRAFDLVSNLNGVLKGPADILTNPKHMEDFGA